MDSGLQSVSVLKRFPLLRFFLLFTGGILFQIFCGFSLSVSGLIVGISLSLSIALRVYFSFNQVFKYGFIIHLCILISAFFAGSVLVFIHTPSNFKNHLLYHHTDGNIFSARIKSHITEKLNSNKVLVELENIITNNGNALPITGKVIVYFAKSSSSSFIKYNDRIIFFKKPIRIEGQKNPEEFDYQEYSSFHGIYHQVNLDSTSWQLVSSEKMFTLNGWIIHQRNSLLSLLKRHLGTGQEYAVASALVIGFDEYLDKELINAYATSGALHVLTVSGMHVGLIFMVLSWILSFMNKIKSGGLIIKIVIICFIWYYALITGLAPSVQRASLMITILLLAQMMLRNTNVFNTMLVSAIVLLIIDPYIITEVGFQLSYAAVFGIIFFYPKIRWLWKPPNKILFWIWNLLCISLAAQLMTFPVGLLYFHMFPNLFVVSNLFVIPLATVVIYGVIILLFIGSVPLIGGFLANCLLSILKWLNLGVIFIDQLPFALSDGIHITVAETIALYGCIFCVAFLIESRKKVYIVLLLSCLILFGGGRVYLALERENKPIVTIYNIRASVAIDYYSGDKHYFMYTNNLVNYQSKMLFHIKHNWWKMGSEPDYYINLDSCKKYVSSDVMVHDDVICLGRYTLFLLNKSNTDFWNQHNLSICDISDYIVITGNPPVKQSSISSKAKPCTYIIMTDNSKYKVGKWVAEFERQNILFHNMFTETALELF